MAIQHLAGRSSAAVLRAWPTPSASLPPRPGRCFDWTAMDLSFRTACPAREKATLPTAPSDEIVQLLNGVLFLSEQLDADAPNGGKSGGVIVETLREYPVVRE